jgi:hypothetical protein
LEQAAAIAAFDLQLTTKRASVLTRNWLSP